MVSRGSLFALLAGASAVAGIGAADPAAHRRLQTTNSGYSLISSGTCAATAGCEAILDEAACLELHNLVDIALCVGHGPSPFPCTPRRPDPSPFLQRRRTALHSRPELAGHQAGGLSVPGRAEPPQV